MSRAAIPLVAGLILVAMVALGVVGGFGLVHTTQSAMDEPATPGAMRAGGPGWMLPPELQFLSTLTPQQRFDHFLGAQMTWVNPQGQNVVVSIIPGTVTAATGNTLTITPNGTNQSRTFNVTSTTSVRVTPHNGTLNLFNNGDRVTVVTVNNSNNASAILEPGAMRGMYPGHYPGRMMPAPAPSGAAPVARTPTTTSTVGAPTATPTP